MPELTGADLERAQLRILECGVALRRGPRRAGGASGDRSRCGCRATGRSRGILPLAAAGTADGGCHRGRCFARACKPLGRIGSFSRRELLLGAARSRSRRKLLQAARGKFPHVDECAFFAMARGVGDGAETPAGSCRDARRAFAAFSRARSIRRMRCIGSAGSRKRRELRRWRAAITRNSPSVIRKTIFKRRPRRATGALGPGPIQKSDVLDLVPPVAAIPKLDGAIPAAAVGRQARADALRSIAFDASAELELRAGYAATGEPRLLLEAAQSAATAGHYGAAIVTVRQLFPQLESQPFTDVPRDVWRVAYALPFEASIRRWSAKAGVDPMLVAGLIRQESAFEPEARSGKSAIGLMQLIGPTARLLARQEKIHYSRARLPIRTITSISAQPTWRI